MDIINKIYNSIFASKKIKLNYLISSDYEELDRKLKQTTIKFLLDKGISNNKEIIINVSIDQTSTQFNLNHTQSIIHELKSRLVKKPKSTFGTDFNKGISAAINIISTNE